MSELPEKLTVQTIVGVRTITDDYDRYQTPLTIEQFAEIIHRCNNHNALLTACKRGHQRLLEMGQQKSHRTVRILDEAITEAEKAGAKR